MLLIQRLFIALLLITGLGTGQVLLQDFSGPAELNGDGDTLWRAYNGEDPGQTFNRVGGTFNLNVPATPAGIGAYMMFTGRHGGYSWANNTYMQHKIKSGTWSRNLNRLSFLVRTNISKARRTDGGDNLQIGTYIRDTTETDNAAQGRHYYHEINLNWTANRWIKVILNEKPQHRVGAGSQEQALNPEDTGATPTDYWDGETIWYFDTQGAGHEGATFNFDDFYLFYDDANGTDSPVDSLIASLTMQYTGTRYEVTWACPRSVPNTYEVRYKTSNMRTTGGFLSGTDGGTVNAPGTAYKNTIWTSPNMAESETGLYVAIRKQGTTDYTQVYIPYLMAPGNSGEGGGGGEGAPATIATDPSNVTVTAPADATFSVSATGSAVITYQWQRNGTNIPSATSSSYTLSPTTGSNNGDLFRAIVTNGFGADTSAAATLTVNTIPTVTDDPDNLTVTAPASAAFSVTATGSATLQYQWQRNGTNIPGATNSSYTLNPTSFASDNGAVFRAIVTNGYGADTSAGATLTVNGMPTITGDPANQSVVEPATASFSVTAVGTPTLTYQWQRNGTNIVGATNSSYTTPATSVSENGDVFRVIVTNGHGADTSAGAVLAVTAGSGGSTVKTTVMPGSVIMNTDNPIRRNVPSGYLNLSGGTTDGSGGNMQLYGPTHSSSPSSLRLRVGSTSVLSSTANAMTVSPSTSLTISPVTTFEDTARLNDGAVFGSSGDVNLYRSAANRLKTDDSLTVQGRIDVGRAFVADNPTDSLEVATKAYVDANAGGGGVPTLTANRTVVTDGAGALTVNTETGTDAHVRATDPTIASPALTGTTDAAKIVATDTIASEVGIRVGSAGATDVSMYRSSANTWTIPDTLVVQGRITAGSTSANRILVTNAAGQISTHVGALSANTFLYGGGAAAFGQTAAPTDGQLLVGRTGQSPVAATLTGTTAELSVTNGAGSITLGLPDSVLQPRLAINTTAHLIGATPLNFGLNNGNQGKIWYDTTTEVLDFRIENNGGGDIILGTNSVDWLRVNADGAVYTGDVTYETGNLSVTGGDLLVSRAEAGGEVKGTIQNTSATAGSMGTLDLITTNTSGNRAYIEFNTGGGNTFSLGKSVAANAFELRADSNLTGATPAFQYPVNGDFRFYSRIYADQRLQISDSLIVEENAHFREPTTSASANITLGFYDDNVFVSASGGNRTVTLPPVSGARGYSYTIYKDDASTNTVTIDADGSETIDGAATVVLYGNGGKSRIRVACDGSKWRIAELYEEGSTTVSSWDEFTVDPTVTFRWTRTGNLMTLVWPEFSGTITGGDQIISTGEAVVPPLLAPNNVEEDQGAEASVSLIYNGFPSYLGSALLTGQNASVGSESGRGKLYFMPSYTPATTGNPVSFSGDFPDAGVSGARAGSLSWNL